MLLVYVLSSNKNEVTVDRVFVAFSILDWFTVSVSFIPVAIFFVTQVREFNVMGSLSFYNAMDIMQCILIAICNYSAHTLCRPIHLTCCLLNDSLNDYIHTTPIC